MRATIHYNQRERATLAQMLHKCRKQSAINPCLLAALYMATTARRGKPEDSRWKDALQMVDDCKRTPKVAKN
ncbi:hypothetical protein INT44_006865 [Umbelopsis vinacea]|uniref:Uncharacterized protein n=1 Tax=Umbelopsis vinacea TaxID=44442 RepID=A0A8H7PIG3_9FUNG|nr:hypothetical protein INT44_006865 [Umbelopsis vinacea]